LIFIQEIHALGRKTRNMVKLLCRCLHLPKTVSMFVSETGNDQYLGYSSFHLW